jgi:hypothetical protein
VEDYLTQKGQSQYEELPVLGGSWDDHVAMAFQTRDSYIAPFSTNCSRFFEVTRTL